MTNLVVYRENALTDDEYTKLDVLAAEKLSVKPKYIRVVKTRQDEYGEAVEYAEYVASGYEIFPRGELPDRLIDSLKRPTLARNIAKHLHRLAAHKKFTRDNASWEIVVEDLCNDLAQVSEYAIIKTCEKFRLDTSSPFFPDTAQLVKEAKDLDWSIKHISFADEYRERPKVVAEEVREKTPKSVRRVRLIVRIGMKAPDKRTKWESRWYDAVAKVNTAEKVSVVNKIYVE